MNSSFLEKHVFNFGCTGSSLLRVGFCLVGAARACFTVASGFLIAVASLTAERGF